MRILNRAEIWKMYGRNFKERENLCAWNKMKNIKRIKLYQYRAVKLSFINNVKTEAMIGIDPNGECF